MPHGQELKSPEEEEEAGQGLPVKTAVSFATIFLESADAKTIPSSRQLLGLSGLGKTAGPILEAPDPVDL